MNVLKIEIRNISCLNKFRSLISKFQITLYVHCLLFSMAKDVKESSLTALTDDTGWKTGDDRSEQIERKVSHESAFPELTDQLTRDFKEGKSVNSASDRFHRLMIKRQNPCVDRYVWEPSACGKQLIPLCRKTSLIGCSSSIRCHGTRKCITIKRSSPACNGAFITECACAPDKCPKTEN